MEMSVFLAKFYGLFLLILCSALIFNPSHLRSNILVYLAQPSFVMPIAIVTILMGLVTVLLHNIWVADWRVLITIFAWFTLIRGMILFYFPGLPNKMEGYIHRKVIFAIAFAVHAFFTLFFLYYGFIYY